LEQLRASGRPIVDLVNANVNDHGIVFPPELLSEIVRKAGEQAGTYAPDSRGQRVAREAIAAYEDVDAGHVLLTPGTSLSYWYAFKLFCEPGDTILCPAPSYPLFDYIARLAGVTIRHYRLEESGGWHIDFDSMEAQITERTRAIVLISPHNPTGMAAGDDEVRSLAGLAARHRLPIIADEVFREFTFDGATHPRASGSDAPLVVTLNGFSKMFALPGFKIGWMALGGEPDLVEKSIRTLELVSDTFLPVHETAQFAVPAIFDRGRAFLDDYRQTIHARRDAAVAALQWKGEGTPRGGFHLVAAYTGERDEEDFALEVLEAEGLLVHPGYFYDIEGRHVVLSFVAPEPTLTDALGRLRRML
jgi:hypothetical protein